MIHPKDHGIVSVGGKHYKLGTLTGSGNEDPSSAWLTSVEQPTITHTVTRGIHGSFIYTPSTPPPELIETLLVALHGGRRAN